MVRTIAPMREPIPGGKLKKGWRLLLGILLALPGGCSEKPAATAKPRAAQRDAVLGVKVASVPLNAPNQNFKRFMDVLRTNHISFRLVGDPHGYHAFIRSEQVALARQALTREREKGLKVTLE